MDRQFKFASCFQLMLMRPRSTESREVPSSVTSSNSQPCIRTPQYVLNGITAKGKIVRKSTRGSANSPFWVVAPSDRRNGRKKNEEVPEKALLTLNETDPRSKRLSRSPTAGTASSYSDDSVEDAPQASTARRSTRGSTTGTASGSSEEQSESSKKRKSDGSNSASTENKKTRKVSFQNGKRAALAAAKKKKVVKKAPARAGNISTRSTRANGGELLSELPPSSKPSKPVKVASVPKPKKNEDVKVIKMLTGTLYLYRGETRRAEFVRSKY